MTIDSPRALDVYSVAIEEPLGRRKIVSRLLWPVRIVAAGLGVLDEPTFGDLVVRRLDDDTEVLRVGVEGAEETAMHLAHVRTQLVELSQQEFDDQWGLDRPGPGPADRR
ncbi:MAG: hypothetical protein PGN07_00935 [Aeromicrobium erythreum]